LGAIETGRTRRRGAGGSCHIAIYGERRQSLGTGSESAQARCSAADPVPWWTEYVTQSHIPTLAIRITHIRVLAGLPDIHKDPFDRILAAQTLAENLVLVSRDSDLARYGIPVIW